MSLTFEEAASGVDTKIRISRHESCEACRGTGAKAGTGTVTCHTCGGRGQVAYQQGFFSIARTCPACRGAGKTIRDACPECRGQGRIQRERTIEVAIPAGVDSGTRLRMSGQGEPGANGGPTGDLYIFLEVTPHEFFQRDGADLHCRVPISMASAALGSEFEVPAIDGSKVRVKVPSGTQTGRRFRLTNKGMPVLRSKQTGDMYGQVAVETPQNLTKRQRELLAEFEKLSSETTQPESAGFFSRVKEFLDGLGSRGSQSG